MAKAKRDFISITDLKATEIWQVLRWAKRLKNQVHSGNVLRKPFRERKSLDVPGSGSQMTMLKNKTLAMIFEKPSLRTRLSFEAGMTQLGGHAIYLGPADIGLGSRESVADVAKVTSSMVDLIMARTFNHQSVMELARYSSVPVINGLSDLEHPCQILADAMTMWEVFGTLKELKVAYVGDCENNVTHSLALVCNILGMEFVAAGPKGYHMDKKVVGQAIQVIDPKDAVRDADVVVTDTWVSMGDESEKKKRLKIFKSYQVTMKLMALAKKTAIFLHCLPAYRGNEVAAEVIDGPQSRVFQEAENRLHVQKALMVWLVKSTESTKGTKSTKGGHDVSWA